MTTLEIFRQSPITSLHMQERQAKGLGHKEIISCVSEYFDVSVKKIKTKGRQWSAVYARQVAMHLVRKHTKLSLVNIGKAFDRDHTTIIHADKTIRGFLINYPNIAQDIQNIENLLLGA